MFSQNRRNLRCLLSQICALSLLLCISAPVFADSEDELEVLKAQRDELVRRRQEQQAVVDILKQQQAGVLQVKEALDSRNMYTIYQIQLNNEEIELYDAMIEDKSIEVDEAKALEEKQLEQYREHVRAMEENGNYSFIAMLLNTSDVGDFLTAIDDIGEIMSSDKKLEDAYIAAREHTEDVRAEYEEYRAQVTEIRDGLVEQQNQLEAELEEADRLISDLYSDIEANAGILAELEANERAAETSVANMIAAIEKERQAAAAASHAGTVVGTGGFVWPVPSCTYITSRFGTRVHPVYGTVKNHTGLDIGASSGATIIAADGGSVTTASVYGSYGNCVIIDHGNGYQTLYGHMSSIAVSAGETVSQGQTIGYVGSTGVSTGPHCHFEVFAGGGRIDPEQFFGGLTFSEDAGV
ncbi:MAG: peptidoglycan DD-metalloendopeptidase family protein [Eubacteriales bacterium]|nr:peptidoglycan DD-metalloendopeptidase family protein [Eubacteriales bacterium]